MMTVISAVINLTGMKQLYKLLMLLFLVISFVSCYEIQGGIHKNLIITDIAQYEYNDDKFRVDFNKMASNGDRYHKIILLKTSNLYDLSLLNDLKAQKLISDSLAKKDSVRLLDIDVDNRKIINISDCSSSNLVNKLRNDQLAEKNKKSDEEIYEHNITMNTILILLMALVTVDFIYLVIKTSQIRRYRSEVRRTASDMLFRITTRNRYIDPDKDLRDAMIRLGYDPKVVNDIMDEVNKEIK